MKYYLDVQTELGWLRVVEEDAAIVRLDILREQTEAPVDWKRQDTDLLLEAKRQLEEYFSGIRAGFSLPLAPKGTDFQKAVWR